MYTWAVLLLLSTYHVALVKHAIAVCSESEIVIIQPLNGSIYVRSDVDDDKAGPVGRDGGLAIRFYVAERNACRERKFLLVFDDRQFHFVVSTCTATLDLVCAVFVADDHDHGGDEMTKGCWR